jgi:hypothetical protein
MNASPSTFGGDLPVQSTSQTQDYVQPTLAHGFRIWWAFWWRNTLLSVSLFVIVLQSSITRELLPLRFRLLFAQYGLYVVGYATAIFIVHRVFGKKFRGFRITLVSTRPGDLDQQVKQTSRRTFRIWWVFAWRSAVYGLILGFVTNIPFTFLTGVVASISPAVGQVFLALMRFAVSAAVGLFSIYSNILDEEISDFRVTLASPESAPAMPTDVSPAPRPA